MVESLELLRRLAQLNSPYPSKITFAFSSPFPGPKVGKPDDVAIVFGQCEYLFVWISFFSKLQKRNTVVEGGEVYNTLLICLLISILTRHCPCIWAPSATSLLWIFDSSNQNDVLTNFNNWKREGRGVIIHTRVSRKVTRREKILLWHQVVVVFA